MNTDDPEAHPNLAARLAPEQRLVDAVNTVVDATDGLRLDEWQWAGPEVFAGVLGGRTFRFHERFDRWKLEVDGHVIASGSRNTLPGTLGADHLRFVIEKAAAPGGRR
ncbi:hypothetical protein Xcel_3458 (plasmid) [Xylanimonas cellulosilytica DSM 15894]|uniref:Uncharacterized protein n=1 Tax=Xylanimonas cellulosilytica (strain DSM 15894 / JCM 12276 / CECT 5975 / KCTC 9989 / LMG 20990 / NBRC 107835 / XIL07) TaxID=446471 RepID=D1C0Z1_XYLCX|nr:hypothetical protein [Xylanimonas cellulosilytica]ACZ32457.1 hypothetical protein Xcel_3458 [Xylanimonas cellulosilytica DSM 15894]